MRQQARVVIAGASGMVGGHVLELALEHDAVAQVTAVGRKPLGITHAKFSEIIHPDFADCSSLADPLRDCDLALFCIGAYTGAVPDDEFRKITVDYTVSFAKVLHAQNPRAAFCLLSGAGADPNEKSRVAFARYKGMAENALLTMGFGRVHIFRPGYIYPVTPRVEPNLSYRIFRSLYPALRTIYPNIGISSLDLARVMLEVGLNGGLAKGEPILENRSIRRLT